MPLVEVAIAEGRSADQIRSMMREVPRAHWATGDLTLTEMDAQKSAGTTTKEQT